MQSARRRTIFKRVRRVLILLAYALLLSTLISSGVASLSASADSPTEPGPLSLIVIAYDGWADLQHLASLGYFWLDWQPGRLAALVSGGELATLRSLGFDVWVLDMPATPEQYYLVSLPPTGRSLPLDRYRHVFSYAEGVFILKAQSTQAEALSSQGMFVQKLLGPIVLPAAFPSAEVDISTVILQEHNPLIQDLVDSVSQTQIYTTVLNLQDDDALPGWDAERSRYSYVPELAVERDYIRDGMQASGLDVRYHSFSLSGTPLDNVEGTLDGWGLESNTVYIVCAHYDSTSDDPRNAAPGADDNASGVAAVLEAARVLSQYRYQHTLRFVTFAGEEQGLYGSYYYVAEAYSAGTDIGGAINLDMVAWDSNGDDVMEIHAGYNDESHALGAVFLNANATYGVSLVSEYITSGSTFSSDHARFWQQGYPAILVIEDFQDFNPYYHQTSDTLDKLDLAYATQFIQATVATLAELAEVIPPGVNVQHSGPATVTTDTPTVLVVQYANPGPNLATGVVITDTLSENLVYVDDDSGLPATQPDSSSIVWQVGQVAPYTLGSFVVTATVETTLPAGTWLTSTVEITGVTSWDDPADNRATWAGFVPYVLHLPTVVK
jgi:uncharacterized repeat protein (TIGR01451 family)